MDTEYFKKLAVGVYKVTKFLPDKEPLRFFIRRKSLEILMDSLPCVSLRQDNKDEEENESKKEKRLLSNIDKILILFDIASEQGWIDERNFIVLKKEYKSLKKFFLSELNKMTKKSNNYSKIENVFDDKDKKHSEDLREFESDNLAEEGLRDQQTVTTKTRQTEEQLNSKIIRRSQRTKKILEFLQERGKIQVGEIQSIIPNVSKRTIRRDFKALLVNGTVKRIGEGKYTFYKLNNF